LYVGFWPPKQPLGSHLHCLATTRNVRGQRHDWTGPFAVVEVLTR
jgi:hypothetical protein